jgi:hypothetical protein
MVLEIFFGGAGGSFVALRKQVVNPPSRHSLYLFGKKMWKFRNAKKDIAAVAHPEIREQNSDSDRK